MAYLFDTDAISELLKPRPAPHYVRWLMAVPREEQYTSYDAAAARVYGEIRARLEAAGRPLADADLQIAATALLHDLELVTGNVRHFERVPQLRISAALAEGRTRP